MVLGEEVAEPSVDPVEDANILGASVGTLQPASSQLCLMTIEQGVFLPSEVWLNCSWRMSASWFFGQCLGTNRMPHPQGLALQEISHPRLLSLQVFLWKQDFQLTWKNFGEKQQLAILLAPETYVTGSERQES